MIDPGILQLWPSDIRCYWPSATVHLDTASVPFADRCQRFLRELALLHPRFEHFGYIERRKGKQPVDVIDMPVEKFAVYVRRKQAIFSLCTPTIADAPTVYISFSHGSDYGPGTCDISSDPALWTEEPLVRNVIALMIDYWHATDANIAAQVHGGTGREWLYWLKWHGDGEPSLSEWHDKGIVGAPSSAEPWRDGMLYTWPEHHPVRLIAGDIQGIVPPIANG